MHPAFQSRQRSALGKLNCSPHPSPKLARLAPSATPQVHSLLQQPPDQKERVGWCLMLHHWERVFGRRVPWRARRPTCWLTSQAAFCKCCQRRTNLVFSHKSNSSAGWSILSMSKIDASWKTVRSRIDEKKESTESVSFFVRLFCIS